MYPKFLRDLGSGQVFTPRQCGLGRAGQCGFHTRGREGIGQGSCAAVRGQGSTAGQGRAVGVIIAGLRFGISGGEKKGETIAVNMEFE